MNRQIRTAAVLLTLFFTLPVIAQDVKSSENTETGQVTKQPTQVTTDDYVFPSSEERLKRYVRSMVGPFALLRISASAGISHWKDSPEEWGQGAEGYVKRFASQFGRNAIRQTVTFGLAGAPPR